MKKKPYILNLARGPCIKETDLIEALQKKTICGAGLDVFEEEPLDLKSPLRKMDNVVLSAHSSNAGRFYWNKVHINSVQMIVDKLL